MRDPANVDLIVIENAEIRKENSALRERVVYLENALKKSDAMLSEMYNMLQDHQKQHIANRLYEARQEAKKKAAA